MKIDRFLEGFTALHEEPGDISTPILIPGDLDPHERHYRFTLHIDTDVAELETGLALIRTNLVELGCPPGTLIQYDEREDRWDGERWFRGEARSSGEDDQEPWRGPK